LISFSNDTIFPEKRNNFCLNYCIKDEAIAF